MSITEPIFESEKKETGLSDFVKKIFRKMGLKVDSLVY
jgi:hypothetical protein